MKAGERKREEHIFKGAERNWMYMQIDLKSCRCCLSRTYPTLPSEIAEILETGNPAFKGYPDLRIMASEDMAVVSRHLPTTYIMLNCKVEGNNFSHHNPGVLFDEAALLIGAGSLRPWPSNG